MNSVHMASPRGGVGGSGAEASMLAAVASRRWTFVAAATVVLAGACWMLFAGLGAASAGADEGRAYEQVSPVDKNGNGVDPAPTVQSSPDGDVVAFSSSGAFAGAATSVSGGYYRARRQSAGWGTDPLDAPQPNPFLQVVYPTLWLSDDLSRAMQFSQAALTPGAIDGGANLYLRDNDTGERALRFASDQVAALTNEFVPFTARTPLAASADLKTFLFNAETQLTPDAAPGESNAYEIRDGVLSLVNVLPDGTVDALGGSIGGQPTNPGRGISADGERIAFQSPAAPNPGGIYLRIGGGPAVSISESRRAGDPSGPQPSLLLATSRDGSAVFFTSTAPLTDDAAGGGGYGDLYRYDVDSDDLVNLTPLTDPNDFTADVNKVFGVSDDGRTVYFLSRANLSGDATSGDVNVYVSRDDVVHHVATLHPEEFGGPASAISPSGRYYVFSSWGSPTGYDNSSATACPATGGSVRPDGHCVEVYRYDAVADHLDCLSCDASDGENRHSDLGTGLRSVSAHDARVVLDNGDVFFNSKARLVASDVNGRTDVYRWSAGTRTLVSPGNENQEATFADASADGRDVFFFTAQQLVGQDTDDQVDLYDARAGGGLSGQRPPVSITPACAADACQGSPVPAGAPTVIATVAFVGAEGEGSGSVGKVKVSKPKTIRGAAGSLRVSVPAAGRLRLTGSGLRAVSRSAAAPSTLSVRIALSARAQRTLKQKRTFKTKARLTFTAAGATAQTVTVAVAFKAAS